MGSFTPDKANLQNLCTELVQLQTQAGLIADQIRQTLPDVTNIIYGSKSKNNNTNLNLLYQSTESLIILEKIGDYADTLYSIINYNIK